MLSRRSFIAAIAAAPVASARPTPELPVPVPAVPQVLGAGQAGSSLITKGWGAGSVHPLQELHVAGLLSVNPQTRRPAGRRRLIVMSVAQLGDGTTILGIWPPIIPSGRYRNCVAPPPNGALITEALPPPIRFPEFACRIVG